MPKLPKLSSSLLLAAVVLSAGPKLSNDLANVPATSQVRVNIRFKNAADASKHGRLQQRHGGSLRRANDDVKGATYQMPARSLAELASDPDIEYVSIDRPVHGSLDYTLETTGAQIAAQYGYDGQSIGVAVIDSGMKSLSDFQDAKTGRSRIVYSESFLPACDLSSSNSTAPPVTAMTDSMTTTAPTSTAGVRPLCTNLSGDDYFGHGTHVAGIIGGAGLKSTGRSYSYTIRGLAPRVSFINLRALDANGAGYDSYVIAAINRAIQLKNKYNIRIINLSLGRQVMESYTVDPLALAVKSAWEAGIVVVCAAGNRGRDNTMNTQGYGTISSPGNSPWVITVGSMKSQSTQSRADDTIASYSSKGPTLRDHVVKPDLVAPGNRIDSVSCSTCTLNTTNLANRTLYETYSNTLRGPSPDYFSLSGTSMATPVVSGTVALMLHKTPGLTPDQVKARLMRTATKTFPRQSTVVENGVTYTSYYDIFTIGAGYLDSWAALNDTRLVSGRALSPLAVFDKASGKVRFVYANNVVWGDNVVWGSNVVWGDSVFVAGSNVIWGDSVVWNGMNASNVVWGDNVVWGESTLGGSSNAEVRGEN